MSGVQNCGSQGALSFNDVFCRRPILETAKPHQHLLKRERIMIYSVNEFEMLKKHEKVVMTWGRKSYTHRHPNMPWSISRVAYDQFENARARWSP